MAEINELIEMLDDFKTRSNARKALIAAGPEKVGQDLLDFVANNASGDNALWAVIAVFTAWKWRDASNALIDVIEKRQNLQGDAVRALSIITGLELGNEADAWREVINNPGPFVSLRAAFKDDEIINFTILENFCKIYLPAPGGRKQEVVVFEEEGRLKVYTECGYISASQVESVKQFNETMDYAQLTCEEEGVQIKATLTAEWGGDDFSELKDQLVKLAHIADNLEEQLTGEDNI